MVDTEKIQRKGRGQSAKSKANLKPFKKGQSGNPDGRPLGAKSRSTILKKWADTALDIVNPITKQKERGTVEDEVILAWLRKARTGDMAAIKEYLDTLYGKIPNKDEITGAEGGPIETTSTIIIKGIKGHAKDAV